MSIPSRYLNNLIEELSAFPGIGRKSAARIAFHILDMRLSDTEKFIDAVRQLKEKILTCRICGGISDKEVCSICEDSSRDSSVLCIVEYKKDVLTIEKASAFKGLYHVLSGVISPLDGVGPEELNIASLVDRCSDGSIREIIIATNPTIEGDATALYISNVIKPLSIRIMRLARGLPVGADLEFSDSVTIAKSLDARVEI